MPENPDIPFDEVKPLPIHHVFEPNKYVNFAVTLSVAPATLFTLGVSPTLGIIEGVAGLSWFYLMYNREVNHVPGEQHSRSANFLLYDARGEIADGMDWVRGVVAKHISAQKR